MGKVPFLALGASLWMACGCDRTVRESPLPASLSGQSQNTPDTAELSAFFLTWYPRDWRSHLAAALAEGKDSARWEFYRGALRLNPGEPLLLYFAALDRLERNTPRDDSAALGLCERALFLDPENGVLDLTRAVTLARLGLVQKARTVFLETRGFPQGNVYGEKLEKVLVGLLDFGMRLNPYDLIAAHDWAQGMPLPPLEEWAESLELIFLDPLLEHPYDIRKRGLEAAQGLFRLGGEMVRNSLDPDRIFSDGRRERLMGAMLQVRASDFLDRYAEAFGGFPGQRRFAPEPAARFFLVALDQASRPAPRWQGFLAQWEALGDSGYSIGRAGEALRRDLLWKAVLRLPACRPGSGC